MLEGAEARGRSARLIQSQILDELVTPSKPLKIYEYSKDILIVGFDEISYSSSFDQNASVRSMGSHGNPSHRHRPHRSHAMIKAVGSAKICCYNNETGM